ncbi:hypothetical protein ACFL0J_02445 [Candidatus Neomarinimicrobiota bacterium]
MNKLIKYSFIFFLLLASCTPFFISHDFEIQTAYHRNIAILPFEMHYTGIIPDELDELAISEIEEAESKAFMISYYNEVLRSTRGGKKSIRVNIQHYKDTFQALVENDVSIIESWDMKAQELASLLQVDAVLRGDIEKNQLITDLESLGIDIGLHILNVLTENTLWPWIPYSLTKSKEIKANYSLLNGQDGYTLWSIAYDIEADWRSPAKQIIDDVNRRSSKKFPYRLK